MEVASGFYCYPRFRFSRSTGWALRRLKPASRSRKQHSSMTNRWNIKHEISLKIREISIKIQHQSNPGRQITRASCRRSFQGLIVRQTAKSYCKVLSSPITFYKSMAIGHQSGLCAPWIQTKCIRKYPGVRKFKWLWILWHRQRNVARFLISIPCSGITPQESHQTRF